jgi:predicted phosphodiesterase
MRYLIISDIHSNLAAFQAVVDDAEGKYDKVWCLGDLVGYGPNPNECIELLGSLDHLGIAGNHDWAVLGKLDVDDFNPDARHVSLWTRNELTESNHEFLKSLPVALIQEEQFTLVHGSPRHPIWEYILYPAVASSSTLPITRMGYAKPRCLRLTTGRSHWAIGDRFLILVVWGNHGTAILAPATQFSIWITSRSNTTASPIPSPRCKSGCRSLAFPPASSTVSVSAGR